MLYKLWYDFISVYKAYIGTGTILVLFVVALGYILFTGDKSEKNRLCMLILSAHGAIGCAMSKVIAKASEENEEVSGGKWGKIFKIIVLCVIFVFVISISGRRMETSTVTNNMHVSEGLVGAIDAVVSDADACDEPVAGVATAPGYGYYFTSYSSGIRLMYEEPKYDDPAKLSDKVRDAYNELGEKYPDMRVVASAAKEADCNYIVLPKNTYWPSVTLTEIGYDIIYSNDEWEIYKCGGDR